MQFLDKHCSWYDNFQLVKINSIYILFLVLLSLVLGALIGYIINVDHFLNIFVNKIFSFVGKNKESKNLLLLNAFTQSSMIFVLGPMAILGAIQEGVTGEFSIFLTKAICDALTAMFMSTSMGFGVAFSSVSVFIYQGVLTLLAKSLQPYLSSLVISVVSGVGGVLLVLIALNLLGKTQFKTANFIPAILFSLLLGFFI